MHLPSFFFHVSIDLSKPSLHLADIVEANKNLLDYRKVYDRQQFGDQSAQHSNPISRKGRRQQDPISAEGDDYKGKVSFGGEFLGPSNAADVSGPLDWRCGNILLRSIDMSRDESLSNIPDMSKSKDISVNSGSAATKGRYEPVDSGEGGLGWGVVRLYRDTDETPGLYDDVALSKSPRHGKTEPSKAEGHSEGSQAFRDEDCTMLCILAVPSYLTPSDFLGFVGEKTREEVSHFRMIRTERSNRYMVLMKFRSGKRAREWRKQWNGRVFNDVEAENCHVVFIKSVEFRTLELDDTGASFPDMSNDPFTPSKINDDISISKSQQPSASLTSKPLAPPTRSLVELPTCPVCLERMDESTGFLTISCQHVFHCTCLLKWRGSGCPVCRFTQDGATKKGHHQAFDHASEINLNECATCRSDANLWICLICGNVGCGRYDAAHAFMHHTQTGHCFSMDMTTQRVWDYGSDGYVHRIMQDKSDGKLMELPSAREDYDHGYNTGHHGEDEDLVPREKLDSIAMEYTHLLTSQLDSQRLYFEEKLELAADRASQASTSAISASDASSKALAQLAELQSAHEALSKQTLPQLEAERTRFSAKASRFEEMARKLEKQWREENTMSKSLMERIEFLDTELKKVREEKKDLEEQNRDLAFFVSGREKLEGMGLGDEVTEGTVSLPEEKEKEKSGKWRKKKKAKPKAKEIDKGGDEGEGKDGEGGGGKEDDEGASSAAKPTAATAS